jgi:GlpG protein
MTDMASTETGVDPLKKAERRPVLTWLVCACCVLFFILLSIENDLTAWLALQKYGYLPAEEIWDGKYWGLITSVFVHAELLHVAFNVYWLWVLGSLLEKEIGSLRWLALFLMAAIVSSGFQLAVSSSTGIGLSGVVYAFFGFMWISRTRYQSFEQALSKQIVILFVGWLCFCLIATNTGIMDVGNAAHISGLAFGMGIGVVFVLRYKVRFVSAGVAVLILASVIPLFWCPWSAPWLGKKAYDAHDKGDYSKAIDYYERSIKRGGDPAWALNNIARAYIATGDQGKYHETLERLRKVDEKAAKELEEATVEKD